MPMTRSFILAAKVALVTTWTTFTPCFRWIFLGGPYIEKLRGNEALTTTLSAITAAVVGVVLNLAVWFGLHVIFPSPDTVDWFAILVGFIAFSRNGPLEMGYRGLLHQILSRQPALGEFLFSYRHLCYTY